MYEIDPNRWIAVLEGLFGPRIGRGVAVCLLALACLAASVFLMWVIWAYGGKNAFGFLTSLSTTTTLETIGPAIATLVWAMIAYGAIIVAILFFFGRALFRRLVPQSALNGLARLRNRGIHDILNDEINTDKEFDDWKEKYDSWVAELLEFVKKNFPESDYLSVEYLGAFPSMGFHSPVSDHRHYLSQLARRLEIIETILNAYRGK